LLAKYQAVDAISQLSQISGDTRKYTRVKETPIPHLQTMLKLPIMVISPPDHLAPFITNITSVVFEAAVYF
jgi:hypothetical protein